ncbi:Hypothetical predicted protein, partial [Marmota monax]
GGRSRESWKRPGSWTRVEFFLQFNGSAWSCFGGEMIRESGALAFQLSNFLVICGEISFYATEFINSVDLVYSDPGHKAGDGHNNEDSSLTALLSFATLLNHTYWWLLVIWQPTTDVSPK